jgi:hypothetical protein
MDYYDLGSHTLDLALAWSEVPVKASCFCRMKVAA